MRQAFNAPEFKKQFVEYPVLMVPMIGCGHCIDDENGTDLLDEIYR